MAGKKQTVYLKVKNLDTTIETYLNIELVNKLLISPDSGKYQIVDQREYMRSKNGEFYPIEVKNAQDRQSPKDVKKSGKESEQASGKAISDLVENVKSTKHERNRS